MAPGDFVIVDQFIDRTFAREKSFFGTGCVAHVSLAHPTCPRLSAMLRRRPRARSRRHRARGRHLPRDGGAAVLDRSPNRGCTAWGCDVIGMTNMPEAKLAREAELCYASVAMVTDYDSWHPDHDTVDITQIIATLHGNAGHARDMVARLPALLGPDRAPCPHGCDRALTHAIMTAPAVAGRVL
jgi:5'-methylthioadenosine phosphorylase